MIALRPECLSLFAKGGGERGEGGHHRTVNSSPEREIGGGGGGGGEKKPHRVGQQASRRGEKRGRGEEEARRPLRVMIVGRGGKGLRHQMRRIAAPLNRKKEERKGKEKRAPISRSCMTSLLAPSARKKNKQTLSTDSIANASAARKREGGQKFGPGETLASPRCNLESRERGGVPVLRQCHSLSEGRKGEGGKEPVYFGDKIREREGERVFVIILYRRRKKKKEIEVRRTTALYTCDEKKKVNATTFIAACILRRREKKKKKKAGKEKRSHKGALKWGKKRGGNSGGMSAVIMSLYLEGGEKRKGEREHVVPC